MRTFTRSLKGKIAIVSLLLFQAGVLLGQNIAITDSSAYTANPSAMVDVQSANKGFLVPRLTTFQRGKISNPATGLLVFDTDEKNFYFFNGSSWANVSAGTVFNMSGTSVYLFDTTYNVGIGTTRPAGKFEVRGDTSTGPDDPLFEVKNKDGIVVFGVYNDGVRVYVNENPTKPSKGGFIIGGYSTSKGLTGEFMRVTPDSVRVYLNDDPAKPSKGGFAIGGYSKHKGATNDYMHISADSTRIYLNESPTKPSKGGFAIGGYSRNKGIGSEYFNLSTDTSVNDIIIGQSRILWYPKKSAFLTGNIVVESPDSVGFNSFSSGFQSKAIGDYSQALGYQCLARGDYSSAIGFNARATMDHAYAFGSGAYALSPNSYAIGYLAKVTNSGGDYGGYAIGQEAESHGHYSYAIGLGAQCGPQNSYALGAYSWAQGIGAYAIGDNAKSVGMDAYAIGFKARALADEAIAIGTSAIANGTISMAIGSGYWTIDTTDASGNRSMAIGVNARATGDFAVAFGSNYRAYPTYEPNLLASGAHSLVIGSYASSNNYRGAIVIGDFHDLYTSNNILKATANYQFLTRAMGGFTFHTDSLLTSSKTFFIKGESGAVGIGTANPDAKLTINSPQSNDVLRLLGAGPGTGYGAKINFGDADDVYLQEADDNRLTMKTTDRLFINGDYDVRISVNDPSPTHMLNLYSPNNSNVIKLVGSGAPDGFATRISFGTSDKVYMEHYAYDKFLIRAYNLLDIKGDDGFKVNVQDASAPSTTPDHKFTITGTTDYVLKLNGTGWNQQFAKLSFGSTDYAYIQEESDDEMLIYGYNEVSLNGGNSTFKVGIRTIDPYYQVDINGDTRIRGTRRLYFGGTGSSDANASMYSNGSGSIVTSDAFNAGTLKENSTDVCRWRGSLSDPPSSDVQAGDIYNDNNASGTAMGLYIYDGSGWIKIN